MSSASVVSIAGRTPKRCRAVTRTGRSCRNRAVNGTAFCRTHADQVRPGDVPGPAAPAAPDVSSQRLEEAGELLRFLRRRLRGEYSIDDFGFDPELAELLLPASYPLLDRYWRVEVIGNEHVPVTGPALLAANHAGTLPVDGAVLRGLVWQHAPHRHLRLVMADLGFEVPFVSHLARKFGATVACTEDASRLLRTGELVGVFPEGYKGIGKGWRERYRLQRFGRGGFVEAAVRERVPIVPVSIVGSEEIYPMVANARPLARLLGLPYVPITPFFPLLGALGMLPLPSKWIVEFGEPVPTDDLDFDDPSDAMAVLEVTDRVRHSIQQTLLRNLRMRRTIFG